MPCFMRKCECVCLCVPEYYSLPIYCQMCLLCWIIIIISRITNTYANLTFNYLFQYKIQVTLWLKTLALAVP